MSTCAMCTIKSTYSIASYFRGVPIFVIFVAVCESRNFKPTNFSMRVMVMRCHEVKDHENDF